MKSLAVLSITALIVFALSTCVNPFDWFAVVSDEVMQANNLYLGIDSTTPTTNNADPWGTIDVDFDRDIDLATVSDTTILLSPVVEWTYSYNPLTFQLSIKPTSQTARPDTPSL